MSTVYWKRAVQHILVVVGILGGVFHLLADRIPEGFDTRTMGFVFRVDTNAQPTEPIGTCFFVSVPMPSDLAVYLVTAKHVLEDTNGAFWPQIAVRLTKKAGGVGFVLFSLTETNTPWRAFVHPDPGVDLAIVPAAPHLGKHFIFQPIPSNIIATKEPINRFNIREGDEMFFVGLFTPFLGSEANIPIVRFGRLSMLTDEKITTGKDGPQHYYFMETQVFGGNSGSAAFFYFDERRNPNDVKTLLGGVVKGYFPNYSPIVFQDARPVPFARENNGIALVTPASKLHELLFSDEQKKLRGEK